MVQTIRKSLAKLTGQEIDDFLNAWERIKSLPPSNSNSLWSLGSFHGQPFKVRDIETEKEGNTWNSYCPHASVLFPIWHRYYCLRLEHALQNAVPETALHYWDQTDMSDPIPEILYKREITYKKGVTSVTRLNPLVDFTFPRGIRVLDGEVEPENQAEFDVNNGEMYHRPKGYTTHRYPFSGLHYPTQDRIIAQQHNANLRSMHSDEELENVFVEHLKNRFFVGKNAIAELYKNALRNPDYNTFSNGHSFTVNGRPQDSRNSLENAHDLVHIAVGGFMYLNINPVNGEPDLSFLDKSYPLANGDMGYNETAAFDPIFWLHHCNVDRLFWIWQTKYQQTDTINIRQYINGSTPEPGATPAAQGPTIGVKHEQLLNLDTPLIPFQDEYGVTITGHDCCNIEELGYTFTDGSLMNVEPKKEAAPPKKSATKKGPNKINLPKKNIGNSSGITVDGTYPFSRFNDVKKALLDNDNLKCYIQTDIETQSMIERSFVIAYHTRSENPSAVAGAPKPIRAWNMVDTDHFLGRKNATGCKNCEKKTFLYSTAPLEVYSSMTTDDIKVFKIHQKYVVKTNDDIQPYIFNQLPEDKLTLHVHQ